jgi:hypothetical protein
MNILTGGNLLGWHKFDDIYKFTNNLNAAVYSFAIFKKVPEKHELPFTLKEVFYVGQTGGQENIFDRKNKDTGKGQWLTPVHKRMKDHAYDTLKFVRKGLDSDEHLCVYFVTPKDYMEDSFVKTWLLHTESEMISFYSYMHGDVPALNKAHKSRNSNVNPDSISQKETKKILESSLLKFIL